MTDRESLLVELVDETGGAIGSCPVADAHTPPGRRHRAFSVLLFDGAGRLLVQRRAPVKTRFALRWSNTCCGHPAPGQDTAEAAAERLAEELGVMPGGVTSLAEAGTYLYRATDPGSGRVEHEWDHVLTGTLTSGTLTPDESEVSDHAWVFPEHLRAAIAARPTDYTPWLPGVLDVATGVQHV